MSKRIVIAAMIIMGLGSIQPSWAGIYNTGDAPQETSRLSPDFDVFLTKVLLDLKSIPNDDSPANPPIRRRYMLMESLGHRGAAELRTVEAKLDYSAVLIRRGKAVQAVEVLRPLADDEQYADNFVILAQCAMAHFLATPELRENAPDYMDAALKAWPATWDQVDEKQKKFLESLGWEGAAFQHHRRCEEHLFRLMKSRAKEDLALKRKKPVAEAVDPIFGPEKEPVRFVNEKGEFEVGRIALAESQKLPREPWDIVEQLLIWMPNDDRLLWLLGEVLNADVMTRPTPDAKNAAIRSAAEVFKKLQADSFLRPIYAPKQIESRNNEFVREVAKLPPLLRIDPKDFNINIDKDEKDAPITAEQWRHALIVGFVTGFAVGLFALWQLQEMRRRRTARAMSNR